MNDDGEWSRCPICFEDYSSIHRPTTFVCGHSACIDHAIGPRRLTQCPICRHRLTRQTEYHVSYCLEEASRLFQLMGNNVDCLNGINAQNNTLPTIHSDEIYARQLQAELDRETTNRVQRRTEAPRVNQTLPPIQTATNRTDRSHQKECGHRCDLYSTAKCCPCADQRPIRRVDQYEEYVDGRGVINRAGRNAYYCSSCKRQ